ncbi:hypothetical protein JW758_02760 [Candidatus Peregrinibacteria bacterium]|nr:hypothetical protein [Candidatus Peregrinibacteria bacterium]
MGLKEDIENFRLEEKTKAESAIENSREQVLAQWRFAEANQLLTTLLSEVDEKELETLRTRLIALIENPNNCGNHQWCIDKFDEGPEAYANI